MSESEFDLSAQPADAFVKAVFSDPACAVAFFQGHLPGAVAASIDWATLKVMPSSFVKQDLQQSHSDLLFTAQASGREVMLYLLLEHQSTVDPGMPLRLLNYITQILLNHADQHGLPLPVVLPFVLHQGPDRWRVPVEFEALFALPDTAAAEQWLPFVPKFRHALLDLTRFDPEQDEHDQQMKVVLNLMKLARKKDLLRFFEWVGGLQPEVTVVLRDRLFRLCLVYAANIDANLDMKEITLQLADNPELQTQAMTLAQKLKSEGRQEGLQEGLHKGIKKGLKNGQWIGKLQLLEQMMQRAVTPAVDLESLSAEELESRFHILEREYQEKFKR